MASSTSRRKRYALTSAMVKPSPARNFFFFKQKTAYEITRDWSSDVCSSDLMENAVTDENWKTCFCQLAPGLVLFARQWARSPADAEDIVQEAFVRFWRKHHDVTNRGLLYEIGRASCRERV